MEKNELRGGNPPAGTQVARAGVRFLFFLGVWGGLLFWAAGTLSWTRGWVQLGLGIVTGATNLVILLRTNPDVVAARFAPLWQMSKGDVVMQKNLCVFLSLCLMQATVGAEERVPGIVATSKVDGEVGIGGSARSSADTADAQHRALLLPRSTNIGSGLIGSECCAFACEDTSTDCNGAQDGAGGRTTNGNWDGTAEQKLWGLMTVWAEAKYNFPFFDQVPELDWDEKVVEYIPRVIAAKNMDAYYRVLSEFAVLLRDGHTEVRGPWGFFNPNVGGPPVELQVVENKFVVARAAETREIKEQRVYPGLEIVAIDGVPIRTFFEERVVRYHDRGTKQANEAFNLLFILEGAKGSAATLEVKDIDGAKRTVTLTRNPYSTDASEFHWRLMQWYLCDTPVEMKTLEPGLVYFKLATFSKPEVVSEFRKHFKQLDLRSLRGMILDIRYNCGGDSNNSFAIVRYLTDRPLKTGLWKTRRHHPFHRARGHGGEGWFTGDFGVVEPAVAGRRYTGPLVVLTGPLTYSASEDFLVPLDHSRRAVLVGETTGGSTGHPLRVELPGGGNFFVVSVKCTYPEGGKEFVGIGIHPEVEVHPTQMDIYKGYDRVLAKGVEVIKSWSKYRPE